MLKPGHLHAHLLAASPELRTNPDKVIVLVKSGQIVAAAAGSLSFEYRYTLNIVLLDYSGHADALIVPVLEWLQTHQIELFDNPDLREKSFRFEAEFLNKHTVDLSLELDLTERVIVALANPTSVQTATRYTITHIDEPARVI